MTLKIGKDRIFLFSFFIGAILLGTLLLSLPGMHRNQSLPLVDTLFTATSAVCVTGLITVDTASFTRMGQLVILLLIQIGGLGIITFATLYVALPGRRISVSSRGIISDYTVREVEFQPKSVIRKIIKYTFIFESAGATLLSLRFSKYGYSIFDGVFHSVSAFCNAGFSTFSTGLEQFVGDPIVNFVIMLLISVGGLGFIVIRDLRKYFFSGSRRLSYHSAVVVKTSSLLVIAAFIAYFVLDFSKAFAGLPLWQKVMASLFQAVTPRTAGFDTIAQNQFSHSSQVLTMILMFIGASPASTGGGIKTTTFFILIATAFRYKEGSDRIACGKRNIPPHSVFKAVGIVVKALAIAAVAVIAILISESGRGNPITMTEALFETVSALGTVGLSQGITSQLGNLTKVVLILTMFTGRVGFFAIAMPKSDHDIEGYAIMPDAEILI